MANFSPSFSNSRPSPTPSRPGQGRWGWRSRGAGPVRSAVGFVLLLLGALSLPAAGLLSTNFPPIAAPALPEASFSVLRVFGALTLVIALFLAGVWLFRNWHRVAASRGRPQRLQILESRSLGGRHALHVVGYQGQRMLLASSPTGIALVSHLPADGVESLETKDLPSTNSGQAQDPNFVQVLQQAIQQKS